MSRIVFYEKTGCTDNARRKALLEEGAEPRSRVVVTIRWHPDS